MRVRTLDTGKIYAIWCPGCQKHHNIPAWTDSKTPSWKFSGDWLYPSFTPAVRYLNRPRCHFNLTMGVIEYQDDCDHNLAGQRIPLERLP
jgi:hypothetical protein